MVGLGTIFIAIMVVCRSAAVDGKLLSAEMDALDPDAQPPISLHRQHRGLDDGRVGPPALAGLWRSCAPPTGIRKRCLPGNGMFTLLGFLGMYMVLGILFLFLVRREIENGPVGWAGVPLEGDTRWQHSGS